jgi:hypothetical protein
VPVLRFTGPPFLDGRSLLLPTGLLFVPDRVSGLVREAVTGGIPPRLLAGRARSFHELPAAAFVARLDEARSVAGVVWLPFPSGDRWISSGDSETVEAATGPLTFTVTPEQRERLVALRTARHTDS